MATKIENLIANKFDDMPLWVRIVVYFVFVFTYIYLLLSPSYIDGRLIVRDDEGGEYGIRGKKQITLWSDGRQIKVEPNEEGYWAIPTPSKIPFGEVDLNIHIGDKSFPLIIPYNYVLKGKVKIRYQKDSNPRFEFLSSIPSRNDFPFFPSAYAESLSNIVKIKKDDIREVVIDTLGDFSNKKDETEIDANFDNIFLNSPTIKSVAIGRIEKELGIQVPDEELVKIETLTQLINVFESKYERNQFSLDREVVLKLVSGSVAANSMFLSPNIPIRKIRNVRKYTSVPPEDEVLALIDSTLFGSASDAMVFTTSGIYYNTDWTRTGGLEKGKLMYSELLARNFVEKFQEVGLGEGQYFVVAGSGVDADDLILLLNDLKIHVEKDSINRVNKALQQVIENIGSG